MTIVREPDKLIRLRDVLRLLTIDGQPLWKSHIIAYHLAMAARELPCVDASHEQQEYLDRQAFDRRYQTDMMLAQSVEFGLDRLKEQRWLSRPLGGEAHGVD